MTQTATPFDFVVADHFRPMTDRAAAIALFRRSVTLVEIETFSYCNRRCWFCPNSVVDRLSRTEYMDEALYLSLLDQLVEAGYAGTISYSRYNEPLADRIILRRLAEARDRLPDATLHANTNGDYLGRAYLDDLIDAGLSSLGIQIYLGNRDRYDHARIRTRLQHTLDKLAVAAALTTDEPGVWLEARATHRGVPIRIYGRNFEVNGSDRGGSVPLPAEGVRTSPCLSPFHHVYVDYTGHVMPCCNLRSDLSSHADAIVADLNTDRDLFGVYAGAALAAWRRSLVGFEAKTGHCASCRFVTFAGTPANRAVQRRLVGVASRSGEAVCA
jgi:hypothetical protein